MAKTSKRPKKFPKSVFVKWEDDSNDTYLLVVDDHTDKIEDGEAVAIYELREVKTKRVTHELK